jgi:hypothetical protein
MPSALHRVSGDVLQDRKGGHAHEHGVDPGVTGSLRLRVCWYQRLAKWKQGSHHHQSSTAVRFTTTSSTCASQKNISTPISRRTDRALARSRASSEHLLAVAGKGLVLSEQLQSAIGLGAEVVVGGGILAYGVGVVAGVPFEGVAPARGGVHGAVFRQAGLRRQACELRARTRPGRC